jgi:hypothetical protein
MSRLAKFLHFHHSRWLVALWLLFVTSACQLQLPFMTEKAVVDDVNLEDITNQNNAQCDRQTGKWSSITSQSPY